MKVASIYYLTIRTIHQVTAGPTCHRISRRSECVPLKSTCLGVQAKGSLVEPKCPRWRGTRGTIQKFYDHRARLKSLKKPCCPLQPHFGPRRERVRIVSSSNRVTLVPAAAPVPFEARFLHEVIFRGADRTVTIAVGRGGLFGEESGCSLDSFRATSPHAPLGDHLLFFPPLEWEKLLWSTLLREKGGRFLEIMILEVFQWLF